MKVYCEMRDFGRYFALVFTEVGPDGEPNRVARLEWRDFHPGNVLEGNETLNLSGDDAQRLMDGLWRGGVRPKVVSTCPTCDQPLKRHYFTTVEKDK